MAYVTDFLSADRRGLMDRVAAARKAFALAREQRRAYTRTLAELRGLSERDLADLGISAAEIPFIARQAAELVK